MTLRDFVCTPAGAVRAGWRALIFCGLVATFYIGAVQLVLRAPRPRVYALFELEQYVVILIGLWLAHYIMLRWVDRAQWSYVGPFFLYSLRDMGTNPTDREDNFGLLRNDYSPKPAMAAFDAAVSGS